MDIPTVVSIWTFALVLVEEDAVVTHKRVGPLRGRGGPVVELE